MLFENKVTKKRRGWAIAKVAAHDNASWERMTQANEGLAKQKKES